MVLGIVMNRSSINVSACVTWLTSARSSAQLKELGPMKIKPTLVGLNGECSMLNLVLIKTRNAPIPTMKIRQTDY